MVLKFWRKNFHTANLLMYFTIIVSNEWDYDALTIELTLILIPIRTNIPSSCVFQNYIQGKQEIFHIYWRKTQICAPLIRIEPWNENEWRNKPYKNKQARRVSHYSESRNRIIHVEWRHQLQECSTSWKRLNSEHPEHNG